jgi:replicative DNA helicase
MIETLPNCVDSERAILGMILLEPEAWYEAATAIKPSDFFLDSHRRIFSRMGEILESDRQLDEIILQGELRKCGELQSIGGAAYLSSLTEGLPRHSHVSGHVKRVKLASQQRRLATACEASASQACTESPESVIGNLESSIEEILTGEQDDASLESTLIRTVDRFYQERSLAESPGLSYGLGNLDAFTGGMRAGEVTVVGARSGVGKTSLACQTVAANCARGVSTLLFSLEMTKEQIQRRLLSIVSGVSYRHLLNPWESSKEEAEQVSAVVPRMINWPLRIYDAEDMTLARMLALGKIGIRRHKARLIVVDYAQEVDAPGKDERAKVMLTCRKLTRLVKQENCSLMLLSQLVKMNRENYGKPPIVSDLIESGKLENVAHCVVLLHRGWDEDRRRIAEDAELIIPKQRRGETGVLKARFDRLTATFAEVEQARWGGE